MKNSEIDLIQKCVPDLEIDTLSLQIIKNHQNSRPLA